MIKVNRAETIAVIGALLCAGASAQTTATTTTTTTASGTTTAVDGANANFSDLGFSYFLGLAGQTSSYHETSHLLPVKSKATSTSPLIVSGALYAINHDILFSLDNQTTFAASSTNETWTATSLNFNGQTLTNPVVQRNGFSLSQNTTDLLGHYRLRDDWFVVAGPALHSQTFKRYDFAQGVDHAVALPSDHTVEESTNEIIANFGVELESAKVRGQANHYGMRAVLGLPIWSRTENTETPGVHFRARSGYDLSLEGRYSWTFFHDIHAGLWGQWMTSERNRATNGQYELPQNRLSSLSYGVELLWKL